MATILFTLTVCQLGGHGVGKTSILTRFTKNKFSGSVPRTVGCDLVSYALYSSTDTTTGIYAPFRKKKRRSLRDVLVSNSIMVNFTDVSHVELGALFHDITFSDVSGVLLVVDLRDEESIAAIDEWRTLISSFWSTAESNIPMMLLANKSDLTQAQAQAQAQTQAEALPKGTVLISDEEVRAYCKAAGVRQWFHVSAKDPNNRKSVKKAMESFLVLLLENELDLCMKKQKQKQKQKHAEGDFATDSSGMDDSLFSASPAVSSSLFMQSYASVPTMPASTSNGKGVGKVVFE